jgi:diguanylate cyclase (GGDEF)-like protein
MQIFFEFDIRTIALFVGMTFLVQAAAIGAQAYLIRDLKQYRGVVAAMAANLCAAAGLILRLMAGQISDFLIVIVSNALFLMGPGLFYIALSQFTGFKYSKWIVIGIIATVLSFLLYFRYWDNDVGKRIIALSLGSATLVFILIVRLWRTRNTPLRFSANLMFGFFLVFETFLIIRTISLLLSPLVGNSGLTPTQSATYLLSFALSIFWSMGFLLMVSQRLKNDLMELATIDVLTRIPNRRAIQAFLGKEISRAQRTQSEFTILLLDIDNFKKVNDRWGHAVGDDVLAKTASVLQSVIRKQDLVGRWGGEEFLIVVAGQCDVNALAERTRQEIASTRYSIGPASFGITVSIGVACAKASEQIDQLIMKADKALYQAKQTKNTVSVAE